MTSEARPQQGDVDSDCVDRTLLQQIAEHRDRRALQRLYDAYAPRITGFLRRMTSDEGLIEEAFNDVMLNVWNKAHQFKGQSKASSWIFSIAYRVCLRMVKRQKFRAGVVEMFGRERAETETAPTNPVDTSDLIATALEKLSAAHRLVIELSYFRDFSTEEIAQIIGCPQNTVKTRMFHARKQIRSFVEQQEQRAQAT
ncbi:MAG: sigma-70 family RNA polymerase sigma factor [Pseudomonadota bacterium]